MPKDDLKIPASIDSSSSQVTWLKDGTPVAVEANSQMVAEQLEDGTARLTLPDKYV